MMKIPPCPECGFIADAVVTVPWGDGQQKSGVAPYLCSACGAFGIWNLVSGTVEFMPFIALEFLQYVNPELHASISAAQARIRAQQKGRKEN